MPITLSALPTVGTLALTFTTAPPVQRPGAEAPTTDDPGGDGLGEAPTPPALPPADSTGVVEAPTQVPDPSPEPTPVGAPTEAPAIVPAGAEATPQGLLEGDITAFEDPAWGPQAPEPSLLRPTEKRRFVTINAGGRATVLGQEDVGGYYGIGSGLDFNLELAVGAHAKRRPSLAGAFVLDVQPATIPHLVVGGRFQWDKPFTPEFALFSSTKVGLGLRFAPPSSTYDYYDYYESSPSILRAQLDFSWGVEAILAERLLLSFRPVNVSLSAPASPVEIGLGVMGGAGVVW